MRRCCSERMVISRYWMLEPSWIHTLKPLVRKWDAVPLPVGADVGASTQVRCWRHCAYECTAGRNLRRNARLRSNASSNSSSVALDLNAFPCISSFRSHSQFTLFPFSGQATFTSYDSVQQLAAVIGILDWNSQRYRYMRTCYLYQTGKNQIQEAENGATVTDSLWFIPPMSGKGGGSQMGSHIYTFSCR